MIKGNPSKDTIVKILDRLSSDNDFREHFLGDPAGALKEYGVEVDSEKIPAIRKLPSQEQIAAIRAQVVATDDPIKHVALAFFVLK